MNSMELLVILVVALIVFGPNKLPMLAAHLGKLFRKAHHLKEQLQAFWETQIQEQQLLENQRKAEKADTHYEEKQ